MLSRGTAHRAIYFASILLAVVLSISCAFASDLRLGIIGTDTSHVIEFTKLLNDPTVPGHVPGAVVVAAFKAGSPDIPISRDRVNGFSQELQQKWHVRFVSKIGDLCPLVDGILLESVDGRSHLDQFRQAVVCGKPVYIEKPLASTLSDARQIEQVAAAHHVAWFSSSPLRFGPVQAMRSPDISGAIVWGPGPFEPLQQLDLSWYAIHPIEILFTLMGPDVQQVKRTYTPNADVITGIWKGGRIGTVRANRPYSTFGAIVFHTNQNEPALYSNIEPGYSPLLREIVKFMRTGVPPASNEETMKIYEFMDAAQQSREHGGIPVAIAQ
ncbi:MAG TPA: Gfo/Idh/MocA family oxidoreductase [Acidobacteriaceae bacterium]|nr:Gfo/Idh/MocA family oxidoreductase [Acidobacteriaceae bacterium]